MTAPAPVREPVYEPHLRVIANGQMGPAGGAWERFSYSFAVGSETGALDIGDDYLADLMQDVQDFHARTGTNITADARLTEIKVAHITADGSWEGSAPIARWVGNVAGGRGPAGLALSNAPQVALAVSLRTGRAGPRGRGRFYLPLPAMAVESGTGLVTAAQALEVATSVRQLLVDVHEYPGLSTGPNRVVVASSYGQTYPVTEVRVGRALDTIRSRRADLMEAYVAQAVPA